MNNLLPSAINSLRLNSWALRLSRSLSSCLLGAQCLEELIDCISCWCKVLPHLRHILLQLSDVLLHPNNISSDSVEACLKTSHTHLHLQVAGKTIRDARRRCLLPVLGTSQSINIPPLTLSILQISFVYLEARRSRWCTWTPGWSFSVRELCGLHLCLSNQLFSTIVHKSPICSSVCCPDMLYSILEKDLDPALCLWQPLPTWSDLQDFAAF